MSATSVVGSARKPFLLHVDLSVGDKYPLRKLINSLLSREKTAGEFTDRYQLPHSDVNDLLTSIAQEKGIRKFNPADKLMR
ncbi:hypothetical protein ABMB44_12535 [Levilactobacillus brevis]